MKIKTTLLIIIALISMKGFSYGTTIAFGSFTNSSKDSHYDYLEKTFPTSLASSLKTTFKINVLKPSRVNKILKQNKLNEQGKEPVKSFKNKLPYKQSDLFKICKDLKSDIFIYGYFTPLKDEELTIKVNIYFKDSYEILSFIETGQLESDIFKLVDRLGKRIHNLTTSNYYFKNEKILKRSKLAFITNLNGKELNYFYFPFLKNGYNITSIQNNSLKQTYPVGWFNRLKLIKTTDTYIDIAHSKELIKIKFSPWMGDKLLQTKKSKQKLLSKYYYNYIDIKNQALDRLFKSHKSTIDYLFFIGFNESKSQAWLRCINMRTQHMIWIETGIKASGKDGESLLKMGEKIIKKFTINN